MNLCLRKIYPHILRTSQRHFYPLGNCLDWAAGKKKDGVFVQDEGNFEGIAKAAAERFLRSGRKGAVF